MCGVAVEGRVEQTWDRSGRVAASSAAVAASAVVAASAAAVASAAAATSSAASAAADHHIGILSASHDTLTLHSQGREVDAHICIVYIMDDIQWEPWVKGDLR